MILQAEKEALQQEVDRLQSEIAKATSSHDKLVSYPFLLWSPRHRGS